jgi:hypothetical protein
MLNKGVIVGSMAAAAAAAAIAIAVGGLKLKMNADPHCTTHWVSTGGGGHVLVLEKRVPTEVQVSGGATITGIEGTPLSDLNAIGWDDLTPNPTIGDGSPRWNLWYGPPNGEVSGYMFLDQRSDTNNDGEISNAEIMANPWWNIAAPAPGDVVKELEIIVDVQERVVLDNIMVRIDGNTTVFGGPGRP